MESSLKPVVAAFVVILALTSAGLAARQQPTFTVGVTQVEVYTTVIGSDGRAVRGLTASDFTLLEDGVPQPITTFIDGEFPASVALAIDRSFSMKGTPVTMARTAGRAFLASLAADDRAMLIGIGGEVEVLAPLDRDKTAALGALASLDPWGTTSLNDAIIRSLELLESETGRRAIVILSDGDDRYSTASAADVLDRARRSDVLMYPVAIGKRRPALFAELASISGGRSFQLADARRLQATLQAIAEDLRAQYLLGYSPRPSSEEDSPWRSISVRVNKPDVVVRARSGYMVQ
jgi:Ca-activated chloride channel family protein